MKKLITISAMALGLALPAFAGTVNLPKADPIATITFPDGWKVEAEDEGVDASSADEEVSIYVEAIDSDSVEAAIKESLAYLEKEKVKVKADSAKQKEGQINGIPVIDVSFDATDKDGEAKVSLTFFVISKSKCLNALYWASPEGEKKHAEEIGTIIKSIKKK